MAEVSPTVKVEVYSKNIDARASDAKTMIGICRSCSCAGIVNASSSTRMAV